MPYQLPTDPRAERRARIAGRVTFAVAALLVALVAYLGYVGYEGSRQMTERPAPNADCRSPATLGWEYEAVNVDPQADVAADCANLPRAGAALSSADGVALAAWYVPAGSGIGPEGPTVVLAHGWGANKSTMLDRAAVLHDAYNLVFFDFRNHGQSGDAMTTQGMREQADLRAVIDWLVEAKAPEAIAVLGASMGGASAANEVAADERVDALVLESTHATLANAAERHLARAGYPLSLPGSWAILMGALVRTGLDLSAADPVQAVARLDERPLLLLSGELDETIGATDATDMLEAATEAGSPSELHICAAGGHDDAFRACSGDYADWVLGFLERALAAPG